MHSPPESQKEGEIKNIQWQTVSEESQKERCTGEAYLMIKYRQRDTGMPESQSTSKEEMLNK